MGLKSQIQDDMKSAMRAGDKLELVTIRMLLAAIKQREIDDRADLDDAAVLKIIEKLVKQRREAATQFASAGRAELQAKELAEVDVLQAYLPEPMSPEELEQLVDHVIESCGATSPRDMGKVMAALREAAQGRADMGALSQQVKTKLQA